MIESFTHSVYFAPRGKDRLIFLGNRISQQYLHIDDRLVGLIGDAGAGKSLLINGMFPGLILTNDDEGINMRPLPLLNDYQEEKFASHTYHVDIRFETAFIQAWKLAEAIDKAVETGYRVVVEHFDLVEKHLTNTPELLIGIGEEVLVTRPGVFGPSSEEIAKIVYKSIKYRRMAHTAEDLTAMIIEKRGYPRAPLHSDVKSGFILGFEERPGFSIEKIEKEVREIIKQNLKVAYYGDQHIKIGDEKHLCTGPRIHLRRTGDIEGFNLLADYKIDPGTGYYILAGFVGDKHSQFELSHL